MPQPKSSRSAWGTTSLTGLDVQQTDEPLNHRYVAPLRTVATTTLVILVPIESGRLRLPLDELHQVLKLHAIAEGKVRRAEDAVSMVPDGEVDLVGGFDGSVAFEARIQP